MSCSLLCDRVSFSFVYNLQEIDIQIEQLSKYLVEKFRKYLAGKWRGRILCADQKDKSALFQLNLFNLREEFRFEPLGHQYEKVFQLQNGNIFVQCKTKQFLCDSRGKVLSTFSETSPFDWYLTDARILELQSGNVLLAYGSDVYEYNLQTSTTKAYHCDFGVDGIIQLTDGRIILSGSNHYTAEFSIRTPEMVCVRDVEDMYSTSLRGARDSTVFSYGMYWEGFHTTNIDDEQLVQVEHDISYRQEPVEDLLLLSDGKLVVRDAYSIHIVDFQESSNMHKVLRTIDVTEFPAMKMKEIDREHIIITTRQKLVVLNITNGDTTHYSVPGDLVCLIFE